MGMASGPMRWMGSIRLATALLLLAGLCCASEYPADVTLANPPMITSGMQCSAPINEDCWLEYRPFNALGPRINTPAHTECLFFGDSQVTCRKRRLPLLPEGTYEQCLRFDAPNESGVVTDEPAYTKSLYERVRIQNTFITHEPVLEASSLELPFEISLVMDASVLGRDLQDEGLIKMHLVSCSCPNGHADLDRQLPYLKISLQSLRTRASLRMDLGSIAHLLPGLHGHSVTLALYGFRIEGALKDPKNSAKRLLQSKKTVIIKDAILLGRSEEPATVSLQGPSSNPFYNLERPTEESSASSCESQQGILYPLPSTSFVCGQMIRFRMRRRITHNPEYLRGRFAVFPDTIIEDDKPRVEVRLTNARFGTELMILGHLSVDGYEVFFPSDTITPGLYKVTITNGRGVCSIGETHGSLSIVGGLVMQPARGEAVKLGVPFDMTFSALDLNLFDKLYIRLVMDNVAMMASNDSSSVLPIASCSGTTKIATLSGTIKELRAKKVADRIMTLRLVIAELPSWIHWRSCFRLEVFGRRRRFKGLEKEGGAKGEYVKQLISVSEPFSLVQDNVPTLQEADKVQIDDRITLDAKRSNGSSTDADCFFGLRMGPVSVLLEQLYHLETVGEQALYPAHQYEELFPLGHLKTQHTVVDPRDGGEEEPAIKFSGTYSNLAATIEPPRPPKRQEAGDDEQVLVLEDHAAPANILAPEMVQADAVLLKEALDSYISGLKDSSDPSQDIILEPSVIDFGGLEALSSAFAASDAATPTKTALQGSRGSTLSSHFYQILGGIPALTGNPLGTLGKRSRATFNDKAGMDLGDAGAQAVANPLEGF